MEIWSEEAVQAAAFLYYMSESARLNEELKKDFALRLNTWKEAAKLQRDLGKPLPAPFAGPALAWHARRDENGVAGMEQGPDFVSDLRYELDPLPAPLPSGVASIGPYQGNGIWQANADDTMPDGATVEHQGKVLTKRIKRIFGAQSCWYSGPVA